MIAVDTSALMAVLLHEPEARAISELLSIQEPLLVSAATLAEALIVADHNNVREEMTCLVNELGLETESVSHSIANEVADAYRIWGRGKHPARLNFGDCFSYVVAKRNRCPLLCVGKDFRQTDIPTLPSP